MTLSRRDFLKAGGATCLIAGAGAALAGCSPSGDAGDSGALAETGEVTLVGYQPVNFTEETDILIIGSGYAGLAAAMAPALAGKKIKIVEKQDQTGGDSATSCCFMFAAGTELQQAAGNPMTVDEYWEAVKEKQTAGYDQYDWYPEWVKGKTYANTKFVDSAINDFGAKFQEPCTESELPRLFGSVILPGDGIGSGGPNILQPISDKLAQLGVE
ncbi:FAD-binding protein, partial [uncultured Adlercreutzia sp.]|uniref:FAD-binding protein n=1 Tax=uncultured Adlercreutzia sp. TaxID=875803 RepID=UPI0026F3AF38